ncbi:MAG TPA: prepilin peptidase [Candidatus Ozemobacteraceae bacterium]|nr:prepilin peptidase [Candidatus Ozemobacteraceae bacterium]
MPESAPLAPDLLQPFLTVFFTMLGSLLGSFSNVVILRMAEGRSVVFPPSCCPHCKHQLSPLDLIPVFGWVLLLGRCRYCRAPISIQYPLVEATAAALTGSAFAHHGLSPAFVATAAWSLIWLIVSIMHLRQEAVSPSPFLWPLGYRLLLGLLVAPVNAAAWGVALAGGVVAGMIIRLRHPQLQPLTWFGAATAGLVSTFHLGGLFPLLLALALLPALKTGATARNAAVTAMFFWNLAGIAACVWTGGFGW